MAKDTFRSAFTKAELIGAAVLCIAGQFVRLGQYSVQAGELISPGFASQSGQDSAQGRLYVDLKDNTTAPGVSMNGTLRLSIFSPQDRPLEIINEWRTETLRTSVTDRTLQIPLPEFDAWISEDKKIVLEFKSDDGRTISQANSTFIMDLTKATV